LTFPSLGIKFDSAMFPNFTTPLDEEYRHVVERVHESAGYRELGMFREAHKALEKIPDRWGFADVRFQYVRILLSQGEWNIALQCADDACAWFETDSRFYAQRLLACEKLGRYNEVNLYFSHFTDDGIATTIYNMACLHYQLGDCHHARKVLLPDAFRRNVELKKYSRQDPDLIPPLLCSLTRL
jgi:tetratricopeptide (TPR) repeat protein